MKKPHVDVMFAVLLIVGWNHEQRVIPGKSAGEPSEDCGCEDVRLLVKTAGVIGEQSKSFLSRVVVGCGQIDAEYGGSRAVQRLKGVGIRPSKVDCAQSRDPGSH